MPKLNERDRLAELEARQRKVTEDVAVARRALRGRYAILTHEIPVERLSEREFQDVLTAAIRVGGAAGVAALRALPDANPS